MNRRKAMPPRTPPTIAPTAVDLLVLGEKLSGVGLAVDVDDEADVDVDIDCDGKLVMFGLVAKVSNEGV